MSRLSELLRAARKADPQLGADLAKEFSALMKRRTFGLVFEQHQPEAVELPGRAVRRGDKVRVLPPRGEVEKGDQRLWRVERIERVARGRVAHLLELDAEEPETQVVTTDDLVVVAEFNDRIYPGLVETGRVERGEDKPFHTVINAENFHALEMLTYTHSGKVDVIYIDPPYNTGARDWKYNNNYVESDDDYRHSKWLTFMERRLKVARALLKPDDSVLIVTIDEKEYARLGLLLEQTFDDASVQMVSSMINPAGSARPSAFSRSDEFLYFVKFGSSAPQPQVLSRDWFPETGRDSRGKARWQELYRRGKDGTRDKSPGCYFPIFVHEGGGTFHSVGEALPMGKAKECVPVPVGTIAVWPPTRNGVEGRWSMTAERLRRAIDDGFVRLGRETAWGYSILYLARGEQQKVLSGEYPTLGRRPDGSVITGEQDEVRGVPSTQWRLASHDASAYGSQLLSRLLPSRKFPFPKSLYAVEDALRFFIGDKPNAIVLDFFAGSGSTAHAVMRLNRQDGGCRQSISVTNNEVSSEEQLRLRGEGFRPNDPEWEGLGICDYITKPRVTAAITGCTPEGDRIKSLYKFTDEFPMGEGFEENAAFFTLTYEALLSVRHNRAFERIAPMLWMRAGSQGRIISDLGEDGWDVAQAYGVLEDLDHAGDFAARVAEEDEVRMAFIITDDDSAFQMVGRSLPSRVVPVRLYESYLQNFMLRGGH